MDTKAVVGFLEELSKISKKYELELLDAKVVDNKGYLLGDLEVSRTKIELLDEDGYPCASVDRKNNDD